MVGTEYVIYNPTLDTLSVVLIYMSEEMLDSWCNTLGFVLVGKF